MEVKTFNNRELIQIRRIAMNVDGDYKKLARIDEKIAILLKEKEDIQAGIDVMEAPVVAMTGGYKSVDIYEKIISPKFNSDGTPKLDKEGKHERETKYVLRYPDTIVPQVKLNEEEAPKPVTAAPEPASFGTTGFNPAMEDFHMEELGNRLQNI